MTSGEDRTLTLGGRDFLLPYTSDDGSISIREVSEILLRVETNYGVEMLFWRDASLRITLQPYWKGKVRKPLL